MKRPLPLIAIPLSLLTLAACNTGNLGPTTRSSTGAAVVIGSTGANTKVNGVALSDTTTPAGLATPGFNSYTNGTDRYLITGKSASGEMSTALITTDGAATPMNIAAFSRASALDLPTSGNANMTGRYVGLLGPTTGTELQNAVTSYVTGDAAITADFSSSTISGEITNRDMSGMALYDITLTPGAIAGDGSYLGTATGGGNATVPTLSGGYAGLLGANGTETAGAIKMLYVESGNNYAELGSFIAD